MPRANSGNRSGPSSKSAAARAGIHARGTRSAVRVSEAPSYGQTVMTYDPASPGALSYLEAAREIARKGAPQ